MFCNNCGHPLAEGNAFCTHCGSPVPTKESQLFPASGPVATPPTYPGFESRTEPVPSSELQDQSANGVTYPGFEGPAAETIAYPGMEDSRREVFDTGLPERPMESSIHYPGMEDALPHPDELEPMPVYSGLEGVGQEEDPLATAAYPSRAYVEETIVSPGTPSWQEASDPSNSSQAETERRISDGSTTGPRTSKPKKRKGKIVWMGSLIAVGILLLASFFYAKSQTGPQVAIRQFVEAAKSKDYAQVASLLSTSKDRWTSEEAESFLQYVEEQHLDLEQELTEANKKQIAVTEPTNGNKILEVVKDGKDFLIFDHYRIASPSVAITVESDLSNLKIDGKSVKSGEEVSYGNIHFARHPFKIEGNTDLGFFETTVTPDMADYERNRYELVLKTSNKSIKVTLPVDTEEVTNLKVFANDRQIGTEESVRTDVMNGYDLKIHAIFEYEGKTFTTQDTTVKPVDSSMIINADLTLAEKDQTSLDQLKSAKEERIRQEEEKKRQEEEELKDDVKDFLEDYREATFKSIRDRSEQFSQFFENTDVTYFKDLKEFAENETGKLKIDYYEPKSMEVTGVSVDGDTLTVTTTESYVAHYLDGAPNKTKDKTKHKTYVLKRKDDSFVITSVDDPA